MERLATHLKHASIDAGWHLLWGFAGGEVGVLGAEEREVGDRGPGGERGQRTMSTGEGAKKLAKKASGQKNANRIQLQLAT